MLLGQVQGHLWTSGVEYGVPLVGTLDLLERDAEGLVVVDLRRPAARERASRWAALLRRVFALDVVACPRRGGRRRLVGVYPGGAPLQTLLGRLGLEGAPSSAEPARSPPRASE
jgi:hypothetical protein